MGKNEKKRKERYSSDSDSSSSNDIREKEKKNKNELLKNAMEMIPKISKKDYYNKSNEFQYWLKKKKKIYFNDLKTEKAKKYFKKFVKKWNKAELDPKYYEGNLKVNAEERTSYKWNINTDTDTTRKRNAANSISENEFMKKIPKGPSKIDYEQQQLEREEQAKNKYLLERHERKRFRKEQMEVLDELVPKATGREALLEKRRNIALFHKANSERDLDVEIPEQELFGGNDDFKARIREREMRNKRREEMKQRNQAEINLKIESYKKKEEETMNMFRKMAEERFKRENK